FDADVSAVDDFLAGPPGGVAVESDANREVTLWTRLNRIVVGSNPNAYTDVMLDRLFDPAPFSDRPTLDRRPPAVDTDVDVTVAGPDTGTAADAIDNTGFSIVTWGTIARPTGAVDAPNGTLPAYILEKPFTDPTVGTEALTSLNAVAVDDLVLPAPLSPGFSLNRGQFIGGGKLRTAERALTDIFSNVDGSEGTLAQIPTDITLAAENTAHQHREIVTSSRHPDGVTQFEDVYVNPLRNDNRGLLEDPSSTRTSRMLRPGDFLGAPAVGPVQMPVRDAPVSPPELDWFTTGELLTLALGYNEAPAPNLPESY
ncbi:Uncharacterized protein SCF082_LOCUS37171, partial [Durusdinium trenchii]